MDPVKISALELENVKRIRAVQIVPTADGLTVIGGRNGQGKTSVLDAIAWALGGKKHQPDNPNRDGGATPAKLHVELSNGLVVERRGKNGTLHVTDPSGKKGTQSILNEFVSELALDLPKFLGGTDKDRTDALLRTLGIDEQLAALDGQIRSAFSRRTMVGQDAKAKRAHADKLPHHDDVPTEPVSVAELVRRQQEILARNGENQRKRDEVSRLEWECQSKRREIAEIDRRAKEAQAELDNYVRITQESIARMQQTAIARSHEADQLDSDLAIARKSAEELHNESTAEIDASIADIESVNAKVRDNERHAEAVMEATAREQEYRDLTEQIEGLRERRVSLLDGAPLPLDGLSIDEDNRLTYNGQTWGDMSGSEQLRVATAIVRATKPDCGFVLVDELEKFDPQQLAEFGAWARDEGLQVIGTRVGSDDACSLIIEDGRVEGQDMGEPAAPDPKGTAIPWDAPTASAAKTWGGGVF